MKYIKEITNLKIFTYNDFVSIVSNDALAKTTLQNYLKKGIIKRIKKNLYTVISLETNDALADKFLIASSITNTSFISHHSAFEFYGYYNQVYDLVNVSSISKFNNFEFEGNIFSLIKTSSIDFTTIIRGVRVSTIERTIVDSIKDSNKYSDLEETLNCINLIPYISENDILQYLEKIDSKILYKKIGVILSIFKEKFNLSDSFFEICHDKSDHIKGYFDSNKSALIYNSKWKIYIYKDLDNYLMKE